MSLQIELGKAVEQADGIACPWCGSKSLLLREVTRANTALAAHRLLWCFDCRRVSIRSHWAARFFAIALIVLGIAGICALAATLIGLLFAEGETLPNGAVLFAGLLLFIAPPLAVKLARMLRQQVLGRPLKVEASVVEPVTDPALIAKLQPIFDSVFDAFQVGAEEDVRTTEVEGNGPSETE